VRPRIGLPGSALSMRIGRRQASRDTPVLIQSPPCYRAVRPLRQVPSERPFFDRPAPLDGPKVGDAARRDVTSRVSATSPAGPSRSPQPIASDPTGLALELRHPSATVRGPPERSPRRGYVGEGVASKRGSPAPMLALQRLDPNGGGRRSAGRGSLAVGRDLGGGRESPLPFGTDLRCGRERSGPTRRRRPRRAGSSGD
jgi:hypothetical protein